ncbi:hypothetical protein CPC16_000189 [Podila verticillata]|nr:hypothetical protein CPC16_000189 [Podila verticillata]
MNAPALKALQPLLATLVQYSGETFTKLCYQGPFAFYLALYGTSMAAMKALAVGARAAPINDVIKAMTAPAVDWDDLIAKTAFDNTKYGDISDVLVVLNLNVGDATDTCKTARAKARAKNYLKYVFQMFKSIFAKAPLWFITNPLLDALQKYVGGYLAARTHFIAPASYKGDIQIYIDQIRALQATIRECTGNKDCNGLIPFMIMVLQVPADTVDSTLKCNTLNMVGCAPGKALRAVIDQLQGLQNGTPGVTVTTAKALVETLKTTLCGMAVVDVVCPLATYVDDGFTRIAQWLNSS